MNILFDISHPQTYHLFKKTISTLLEQGEYVHIIIRPKDILPDLIPSALDKRCITITSRNRYSILNHFHLLIRYFKIIKFYNPDIILNNGAIYSSIISLLFSKKLIIVDNTDCDYFLPFAKFCAHTIITPACFYKDFGIKHKRFRGINEMAYLPTRFQFSYNNYLDKLGLIKDEPFCILRFVRWKSHDDLGNNGLSEDDKIILFRELNKVIKVFISSESEVPVELNEYRLEDKFHIYGEIFHWLIEHSFIVIGESGAIAAEAALLGAHSVFISEKKLSTIDFLENEYHLIHRFQNIQDALDYSLNLIKNNQRKSREELSALLSSSEDINELIYSSIMGDVCI